MEKVCLAKKRKLVTETKYVKDQNKLFQTFPVEIWMLVLEKVKDPKTLQTLHNSSDVFRDLLLHRRNEFLFPLVLKYLEPFLVNDTRRVVWDSSICRDCGRHRRVESAVTDMITTRLVCKTWCLGVEEYCENACMDDNTKGYKWSHDFSETGRVLQMMRHFLKTHPINTNEYMVQSQCIRSPLLGRSIKLCLNAGNYWDHTLKQEMLNHYGQGILDATFLFFGNFEKTFMIAHVENWLRAMPCLRSLKLLGDKDGVFGYAFDALVNMLPTDGILDHLERLEVQQLPAVAVRKLMMVCRNSLNSLVVRKKIAGECSSDFLYVINEMKKLKSLSLDWVTTAEFSVLENAGSKTKFESLHLDFGELKNVSLYKQLLLFENNWKETLTSLSLKLGHATFSVIKRLKGLGTKKLNLPNLKHLSLEMQFIMALDCLLPMKQLETLNLKIRSTIRTIEMIDYCKTIVQNQKVQLIGFQNDLSRSNIWEIFKSLRNVSFRWNFETLTGVYFNTTVGTIPVWIIGHGDPYKNEGIYSGTRDPPATT